MVCVITPKLNDCMLDCTAALHGVPQTGRFCQTFMLVIRCAHQKRVLKKKKKEMMNKFQVTYQKRLLTIHKTTAVF